MTIKATNLINPRRCGNLLDFDPWARLAGGMLTEAADEARAGDLAAAEWLMDDDAAWIADVLGLEFEAVRCAAAKWAACPAGRIIIRLIVGGVGNGSNSTDD